MSHANAIHFNVSLTLFVSRHNAVNDHIRVTCYELSTFDYNMVSYNTLISSPITQKKTPTYFCIKYFMPCGKEDDKIVAKEDNEAEDPITF